MTLSTHNPFLINDEAKYTELFEQRMDELRFNEAQKEEHRRYENQYASILYTDNAIRNFINSYKNREDFANTIFVITGDHRMPEIPMATKIDRYHVPLIIYSPLLKRSQTFGAISTHLDITPSLLALLSHRYNIEAPKIATWLGEGLDTGHVFRNLHAYPFMQTNTNIEDLVMDGYMLNGNDLFKISNNMGLDPVTDDIEKAKLQQAFAIFKDKNNRMMTSNTMIPDSLMIK